MDENYWHDGHAPQQRNNVCHSRTVLELSRDGEVGLQLPLRICSAVPVGLSVILCATLVDARINGPASGGRCRGAP